MTVHRGSFLGSLMRCSAVACCIKLRACLIIVAGELLDLAFYSKCDDVVVLQCALPMVPIDPYHPPIEMFIDCWSTFMLLQRVNGFYDVLLNILPKSKRKKMLKQSSKFSANLKIHRTIHRQWKFRRNLRIQIICMILTKTCKKIQIFFYSFVNSKRKTPTIPSLIKFNSCSYTDSNGITDSNPINFDSHVQPLSSLFHFLKKNLQRKFKI